MPRPATSPHAKQLNVRLGSRIAARRRELGIAAGDLERELLLSAGTVGRIERGDKGLDAGLLIALSGLLKVPVGFFFEGLPIPPLANSIAKPPADAVDELTEFLTLFHGIDDDGERRQILALVRSMAESEHF